MAELAISIRSKMTEYEQRAERLRIRGLSGRISRMNEVDFEGEKGQVAKEFKNTWRIEESQQRAIA